MKVAIVFPSGHLTTTPCITSLAILLAQRGIKLHIYAAENTTTVTDKAYSIFNKLENLELFIYPIKSKQFYENIPLLLLGFFPWCLAKVRSKKYDLLIAAGVRSLFLLGLYSLFTKQRYSYMSLELYIKTDLHSIRNKIFKFMECFFNKRAIFSIIQDEQRARILQRENRTNLKDILIFPNSPLKAPYSKKLDLPLELYDKYTLKHKKVALSSGSIFAPWAMTRELIKEAKSWPEDWVLLLHSRAKLSQIKTSLVEISHIPIKNVIFSSYPLDKESYETLINLCHVGIALYDGKASENIYYVGYSSGKIAHYLKCGLPIVVNKLPVIKELVENYKCGVVVSNPQDIRKALIEINLNYDIFSANAHRAYDNCLNPEIYIDFILLKLFSIDRHSSSS